MILTYSPWLKVCGEDVLVLLMMVVRELRREANMSYSISPCCPGNTKDKSVDHDAFITTLLCGPPMNAVPESRFSHN